MPSAIETLACLPGFVYLRGLERGYIPFFTRIYLLLLLRIIRIIQIFRITKIFQIFQVFH